MGKGTALLSLLLLFPSLRGTTRIEMDRRRRRAIANIQILITLAALRLGLLGQRKVGMTRSMWLKLENMISPFVHKSKSTSLHCLLPTIWTQKLLVICAHPSYVPTPPEEMRSRND